MNIKLFSAYELRHAKMLVGQFVKNSFCADAMLFLVKTQNEKCMHDYNAFYFHG